MRIKAVVLLVLLGTLITSCGFGNNTPPPPIETDTPVPPPTQPPTVATPLAILVVPTDMDQTASQAYQKIVYDLAQGSGMRFQVRNTFTAADLEPGLQILIALPPDPGIAALAAAAPHVQFVAVNIPGIAPAANISVLGSSSQVDVAAFVAGYTAAMISDDYHTGIIIPKDNADAQRALVAYTNGMAYYCGLCQPFYYVSFSYPAVSAIPAAENKTNYAGYVNYLVQQKVYTIYLYPDIAIKQLTDYIGQTGLQFIGVSLPNPKPGGWVMTIRPDETKAIQAAWPALVAGKGGQTFPSPLGLADVDPTLLSPGKERLVQNVLDGLLSGRIVTGAEP